MAKKKQKTQPEKTVQDLIPIRGVYNEVIETNDKRLIKVLSVSAINTHLMSFAEEKEVLESYEAFLKELDQPIQIARVTEPIDLQDYIRELTERLNRLKNPHKIRILKNYIKYAKNIQADRTLIRRSRYLIFDEPFSDEVSKEEAMRKLRNRVADYRLKIESMIHDHPLSVRELSNDELQKYLHMFFDYEQAQLQRIDDPMEYPYMIGTSNLMQTAERLKQKDEYL